MGSHRARLRLLEASPGAGSHQKGSPGLLLCPTTTIFHLLFYDHSPSEQQVIRFQVGSDLWPAPQHPDSPGE